MKREALLPPPAACTAPARQLLRQACLLAMSIGTVQLLWHTGDEELGVENWSASLHIMRLTDYCKHQSAQEYHRRAAMCEPPRSAVCEGQPGRTLMYWYHRDFLPSFFSYLQWGAKWINTLLHREDATWHCLHIHR